MSTGSAFGQASGGWSGISGFSGTGGGGATAAYGMAYRASTFDIGSVNTWVDVPLNGGNANLTNITHSTSTDPEKITVGVSGIYLISYRIQNQQSGASHHQVARLYKNGNTEILGSFCQVEVLSDANDNVLSHAEVIAELEANDYIVLQIGTNVDVNPEIGMYIGPPYPLPAPTTRIYAIVTIHKMA